jgi:small-conductance mechanosensitive channel
MPRISYETVGAVIAAFVLAAIAARVARASIDRALKALEVSSHEHAAALRARARQLTRMFTVLAYGVASLASISMALERFGVDEPRWNPRLLAHWTLTHGVNLVLILVVSYIVVRAASLLIDQFQFNLKKRHGSGDLEWQRRSDTLGGILSSALNAVVGVVAVLMLLRELSIDILPILTGAGVAGLAIGFGAQNLVRDIISGFFIILEDQVRVGDLARINGVTGTVEHLKLRTTILRDGDGAVQVFPNGTITALANLSKQFGVAVVDVRIAYYENMDRVFGTMREVGAAMQNDPHWAPLILAPLDVLGVEALADGLATIRVKFKTQPLGQGKVATELRRRLMTAFVQRGIKPFA